MNVQLLDNRVLVMPTQEETSAGGILIPTAAQEKSGMGEVKFIGNGKLLDNGSRSDMTVKIGDTVLYGKYSGTEVKLDGVDYVIVREEDIMGIIA
jgi:chaperonin GroES